MMNHLLLCRLILALQFLSACLERGPGLAGVWLWFGQCKRSDDVLFWEDH